MSDDLVPEEGKQEYTPLLTILQSSSQGRVPIADGDQAQIVARVRARLAQVTPAAALPDAGTSAPQRQFVPRIPAQRARKPVWSILPALVVIGLIIGSLALFRAYPFFPGVGTPILKTVSSPGPTARTQVDGLEASMRVLVGGPYFLSELISVDVSLTNHTHKPVMLNGTNRTADLCFASALMVQLSGGGNPAFSLPRLSAICELPAFATVVQPRQTLTIRQYVPLTRSREVTLVMGPSSAYIPDPLAGHWPTIHMQVDPHVPQDRALSLHAQEGGVMIITPAGANVHLLYMQSVSCRNYFVDGSVQWTPLATNVLSEPLCPTAPVHWEYIVSAPGYAIVSGSKPG